MSFTVVPKPTKGLKPKELDKPSSSINTWKEPKHLYRNEFHLIYSIIMHSTNKKFAHKDHLFCPQNVHKN